MRSTPAPPRSPGRPIASLRVARALLPALIRAIDWIPFAAVLPIAVAITALGAPTPDEAVTCLRVAAVLLGAAAAFALIDLMEPSTAALPVPRALRQGLRTLIALFLVALSWAVIAAVVTLRSRTSLPWSGLTLEAAVLTTTALAAAALAVHRVAGKPAAGVATAALLALIAATLPLTGAAWPWPEANTAGWSDAHRAWALALPVPLLVLYEANRRPCRRTT
jgi:hypothetical protein